MDTITLYVDGVMDQTALIVAKVGILGAVTKKLYEINREAEEKGTNLYGWVIEYPFGNQASSQVGYTASLSGQIGLVSYNAHWTWMRAKTSCKEIRISCGTGVVSEVDIALGYISANTLEEEGRECLTRMWFETENWENAAAYIVESISRFSVSGDPKDLTFRDILRLPLSCAVNIL